MSSERSNPGTSDEPGSLGTGTEPTAASPVDDPTELHHAEKNEADILAALKEGWSSVVGRSETGSKVSTR